MQAMYMGRADAKNRYLSPLLADFDGLPPMLGMVGSTEILLDDTIRAASQAARAKVPFNLEIWEQMPHVFPFFAALPESDVAIDRIAKFINQQALPPLPSRHGREKANREERRALSGR
jgi:acetyl esterase/lipase